MKWKIKPVNKHGKRVSPEEAVADHKPGDRYMANGIFYRLHVFNPNKPRSQPTHFEREPRWNP